MSSDYVIPVSLIPGTVWDQVGWWDEVRRNRLYRGMNGSLAADGEGMAIRQRRCRAGLTPAGLARLIGVDPSFVWQMEHGTTPIPRRLSPLIDMALDGALDQKAA